MHERRQKQNFPSQQFTTTAFTKVNEPLKKEC